MKKLSYIDYFFIILLCILIPIAMLIPYESARIGGTIRFIYLWPISGLYFFCVGAYLYVLYNEGEE